MDQFNAFHKSEHFSNLNSLWSQRGTDLWGSTVLTLVLPPHPYFLNVSVLLLSVITCTSLMCLTQPVTIQHLTRYQLWVHSCHCLSLQVPSNTEYQLLTSFHSYCSDELSTAHNKTAINITGIFPVLFL